MWDPESLSVFLVPDGVLGVFIQASPSVLPFPDALFIVCPEGELSDGVVPHFRSKDIHVEFDLVLHWLAEPCVRALEEKYESINALWVKPLRKL